MNSAVNSIYFGVLLIRSDAVDWQVIDPSLANGLRLNFSSVGV
jgi:hypothetical protein